jgi:hypothetical protein
MIKEKDCTIIMAMSNHTSNSLIASSMCLLIVPLSPRQSHVGCWHIYFQGKISISEAPVNGGTRLRTGQCSIEKVALQFHFRIEVWREGQSSYYYCTAHIVGEINLKKRAIVGKWGISDSC